MSAMMYKSDVPDTGFSLPLPLSLLWFSDDCDLQLRAIFIPRKKVEMTTIKLFL